MDDTTMPSLEKYATSISEHDCSNEVQNKANTIYLLNIEPKNDAMHTETTNDPLEFNSELKGTKQNYNHDETNCVSKHHITEKDCNKFSWDTETGVTEGTE